MSIMRSGGDAPTRGRLHAVVRGGGVHSTASSLPEESAMRLFLTALLGLALSACASSALVTGTPRAPIDPSQVCIYFSAPPGGYEEIALLESSSGAFTYGAQNKMDSVVAKLRKAAARRGANGVLFRGTADGYGRGGVTVGAGGGRVGGSRISDGGLGVDDNTRS